MEQKIMNERKEKLFRAILSLQTTKDCDAFFEDLCTKKEVEQMAERLFAAELLTEGKTYEEVISITEISSATLSRVSKCVKSGSGYKTIIKKLKMEE